MSKFIAKSEELINIMQCLTLVKKFFVSSLLIGEEGNGKKTLARYILPHAVVVNGEMRVEEIEKTISQYEEVIITNFEKITNFSSLNFDNKRIIATALYQPNDPHVDDLFGYIYEISPLSERLEDAKALADIFLQKAKEILDIDEEIELDYKSLDFSKNSISLKKSIYKYLILRDMKEQDLESLLYHYFLEEMAGNNDYKKFLYLYEKPLIEAGLKRYKSQLKLASILGINRNTLRKKVQEYGI